MKRVAMATGLAAALAAAVAVLSHGDPAVFFKTDSGTQPVELAGYGNFANSGAVSDSTEAVHGRGFAGRPDTINARPGLPDSEDRLETDLAGGPGNAALIVATGCRTENDEIAGQGLDAEGSIHALTGTALCGTLASDQADAGALPEREFAELEMPDSLTARSNVPDSLKLRPRHGQALGPTVETFDLLKPGSAPPASSSASSTSDYKP